MVDRDLSGDESLNDEFGIPKVQNPRVRRSTHAEQPMEKLKYNSLATCHFMYMANVVQDVEPTCFSEAVGVKEWDVAMDDEMDALGDSGT